VKVCGSVRTLGNTPAQHEHVPADLSPKCQLMLCVPVLPVILQGAGPNDEHGRMYGMTEQTH
jgi:hypothetical protein